MCIMAVPAGCADDPTRPMPHTQALVEPAEIARVGRNSPKGILLQLWRSVQVGNAPSAAAFYERQVLRALGFQRISGALSQQRSHLEVLRPTSVTVSRTPLGLEVVVKAENMVEGTRAPTTEVFSFLLRRSSQSWRVAYDTLLGAALPGYIYSLVQQRVAPGSNTPAPEAQVAARKIGDLYRSLLSREVEQTK
jgi:hypothetical protein